MYMQTFTLIDFYLLSFTGIVGEVFVPFNIKRFC